MDNNKIKIKEVNTSGQRDVPRYAISFIPSHNRWEDRVLGHEILSALIGERDAIVEVKSSFLNVPSNEREDLVIELVKTVKGLEANYRYRKTAEQNRSMLSSLFSFRGKPGEAHELLIYMPNGLWKDGRFNSRLPNAGVKYYILREKADGAKILDALYNGQLLEDEKEGLFELALFDGSSFGQIGIFTNKLSLEEVKALLGFPPV